MSLSLHYLQEFVLACAATLGFGILFNVPRQSLFACCLTGALGRTVRLAALDAGANLEGASYLGAVAVAITGYLMARLYHTPRTIFTVTGVIPMVPGVTAFSSMLDFANGNILAGLVSGTQTVMVGGALALGLTTVRIITRMPGRSVDAL